jgi:hypothetical protein
MTFLADTTDCQTSQSLFHGQMSVCTHLTLLDFFYKQSKFLVHFINPCRNVVKHLAWCGDVRLNLFCSDNECLVTGAMVKLLKCTDQALELLLAFLSVESSQSQLASVMPPLVSIYSPTKLLSVMDTT